MKAIAISYLLLISIAASATEFVIEPAHSANRFAGVVLDPTGVPISDVSVEVVPCGSGEFRGHVLSKEAEVAHTDANGKFVVQDWHHDVRTCISFSREGFNYHQFELKYKSNAGSLVVKLTIAA